MPFKDRAVGNLIEIFGLNYVIAGANNGDIDAVSFRSKTKNSYLRHSFGNLIESNVDPNMSDALFCYDSSFLPEICEKGIIFKCTNPGMSHLYLTDADGTIQLGYKKWLSIKISWK
jgi:hypothetical protein